MLTWRVGMAAASRKAWVAKQRTKADRPQRGSSDRRAGAQSVRERAWERAGGVRGGSR